MSLKASFINSSSPSFSLRNATPILIETRNQLLEMLEENLINKKKMLKAVREFRSYIEAHQAFIPNYGDRYRHDEAISTAFVESTVNYVVSKRFVKKQQMRWTQRGAHLLLQTRVQVLNDDLRKTLGRWFPGMRAEEPAALKEAA